MGPTFKQGVGSVGDAAAVGPVVQTPLCKLEEKQRVNQLIWEVTWSNPNPGLELKMVCVEACFPLGPLLRVSH